MEETPLWVLVCMGILIFIALVGIFGGMIAGDLFALRVALFLCLIECTVILWKAKDQKP